MKFCIPPCVRFWAAIVLFSCAVCAYATSSPDRPAALAERVPQADQGVTQLSNAQMKWLLDAKLGMLIHWGLYSGPGQGEWFMEHMRIPAAEYRKYAFPESGDDYFDAKDFHPEQWAQLAKDAGMKWMCLTTRHHDGFCLFDSPHPNAFTSQQTLGRDLVKEYVEACRNAGLRVGIYYSPLSWRYPGYYDVTGRDMHPNRFGYVQNPSDKENARLMKEENYVNVKKLLTDYGRIDFIFWDGGWLAQKGTDAETAFFHEPGKYLAPNNEWPISAAYLDREASTGKPLGIMGMVRKYQPDAITDIRYGWIGDILELERVLELKGPICTRVYKVLCISIQHGAWGYDKQALSWGRTFDLDELIRCLGNAAVRNVSVLFNVSPDRHGVIPEIQQQRLHELGAWLRKNGDAFYGTRGGPWQPVDHQYGYTFKDSTVFIHLFKRYAGSTFLVPPMGDLRVKRVYDLGSGHPLPYTSREGGIEITSIPREASPTDTILAVTYDEPIRNVWRTEPSKDK
jgi:alpha-L-fucosidase